MPRHSEVDLLENLRKKAKILKQSVVQIEQYSGVHSSNEVKLRLRAVEGEISFYEKRQENKKIVFIAYTSATEKLAKIAIEAATDAGFAVRTGFDEIVQQPENIVKSIVAHIATSSCFIGIWGADFAVSGFSGTNAHGNSVRETLGTIPGVWMPFELGVAVACDKPYRLLVKKGTNREFCEKLFFSTPHFMYDEVDFRDLVKQCVSALVLQVGERTLEMI